MGLAAFAGPLEFTDRQCVLPSAGRRIVQERYVEGLLGAGYFSLNDNEFRRDTYRDHALVYFLFVLCIM